MSAETVIDAEIRVPDSATASWVVSQIKALLAERGDDCRLVAYGIYPAAVYDSPAAPDPESEVPA